MLSMYGAQGAPNYYPQGGWAQPNAGFQGPINAQAMQFFAGAGANPNASFIYAPLTMRAAFPAAQRRPMYSMVQQPRPDMSWIQSLLNSLAQRPAPPPPPPRQTTQVVYHTVTPPPPPQPVIKPIPVKVPLPPPPIPVVQTIEPVALAPVVTAIAVAEPVAVADPIPAPKQYKSTWMTFNIGWQTETKYTLLGVNEPNQTADVEYVTTRANTSGLTQYQIELYDLNNVHRTTIPLSQVPLEGQGYGLTPGTIYA